jgi:poly(A) polymerase
MTEREFATDVVARLQAVGFEALFAGGCVRDELLGIEPADHDVATSATPDQVKHLFKRCHSFGASFGVVEVLGPRDPNGEWLKVQVATFRSDGTYTDGRRPDSVVFSSPKEDAERRDFTINGLFRDPITGKVFDYIGGEKDLRNKVLRAIGDPNKRFEEDKLRILRAVRMAARFELEIEPYTEDAMKRMVDQIQVVSAERIAEEFRKILKHPNREQGVRLLQSVGLLNVILPETRGAVNSPPFRYLPRDASFEVGFARMLWCVNTKTRMSICQRLRLSKAETELILWFCKNRGLLAVAKRMSNSQLFPLLAHPSIRELVALQDSDDNDPIFDHQREEAGKDSLDYIRQLLRDNPPETFNPPPLITGDDLVALGMKPGKEFKRILDTIRANQLDGEVTSKADALEKVQNLRSDAQSESP